LGTLGEIYGRARRAGQNIEVYIELEWGFDTDGGTGYWAFTLPDDGGTSTPTIYEVDSTLFLANGNLPIGTGIAEDISVGATRLIATSRLTDETEIILFPEGSGQSIRPGSPFTWATGDRLIIQLSYPVVGWGAA
jgi:hypothetical protein